MFTGFYFEIIIKFRIFPNFLPTLFLPYLYYYFRIKRLTLLYMGKIKKNNNIDKYIPVFMRPREFLNLSHVYRKDLGIIPILIIFIYSHKF